MEVDLPCGTGRTGGTGGTGGGGSSGTGGIGGTKFNFVVLLDRVEQGN